MSNGIHPLRPGTNPYLQSSPGASAVRQTAGEIPEAGATAPAAESARARYDGLSSDESALIDELFPGPAPSLQLYDPRGANRQVTPQPLGGRLDLRA